MQAISDARGRFVWYELMTTDVKAAIEFYTKVICWEVEDFQGGGDGPPYKMWKIPGGTHIGGVFPLPDEAKNMGAPPHWFGNICVENVDDSVTKLQTLGGRVHHPAFDVPNVGRVAIVADPTGASFALYQPSDSAPGHNGKPAAGEISWHELMSTDPEAAWTFYSQLLGWKKTEAMDMGPMGTYQMFGAASGGTLGGMMRTPPEMPASAWSFYVYTSNLDGAIEAAIGRGAVLVNGPNEVPGGDRVATLRDPQGAFFSLHGGK